MRCTVIGRTIRGYVNDAVMAVAVALDGEHVLLSWWLVGGTGING